MKDAPINLGKLQAEFDDKKHQLHKDERALKKAQDQRDSSKSKFAAAEAALRDGTRAVLG